MRKDVEELKPLTEKETLRIMIVQKQDELTKAKALERMFNRNELSGKTPESKEMQLMAHLQKQVSTYKKELFGLIELYKESKDEVILEKELQI